MSRTLLIEDHPDTQDWMASIIARAFPGTVIDVAGSLEAAFDLLAKGTYERAVIDLNLPDGSGIDIIRHIVRRRPDTQIVVATIFDDEDHLLSALQAGAKGYVLKHQSEATLVRTLEGMARGEPPLSPVIARRILDFFETDGGPPRTAEPLSEALPGEELLTERESEVLEIIARGASKQDVANSLRISPNTVASHIKSIYRKLGISSRAEASLAARRLGLLDRDGA